MNCAWCKREFPIDQMKEYDGQYICRDAIGCEYTQAPWKNPELPKEERKAAKLAAKKILSP